MKKWVYVFLKFSKQFKSNDPEVLCKKTVFLKISQNSQENIYVAVSF